MKDLGILKYFLGVEVARNATGIFVCQHKYILDIISKTGLLGAKPAHVPVELNQKLALAQCPLLDQPERYKCLVGSVGEYHSMAATTCELKWLKGILSNLWIMQSQPMQLYCDSLVTLHIAKNSIFHERTKQIEIDCHFVHVELVKGTIKTT
uniref:Reverse transcriptase Ty1/copia-type domain-containing protein n=1 Tax=Cajanus cajan TaxID=3821 RepID=A0A151T2Y5_CAJCA|nr:hypothetical protein KK1_015848 [Cajanus cajan]